MQSHLVIFVIWSKHQIVFVSVVIFVDNSPNFIFRSSHIAYLIHPTKAKTLKIWMAEYF